MNIRTLVLFLFVWCAALTCTAKADPLRFTAKGEAQTLTMPDGREVHYTAYEHIFYVTNVEDAVYQTLNFYVPDGAGKEAPIFLRTYVAGYMASAATAPSATDASGRALAEGFCVCIPGSRGSNSMQGDRYTGKAPNGLLDLKAAVRYLRHNDKLMAGSAERIITDGTSAGGAMSALLGATANHPEYAARLKQMGAADASDAVYAAVCYCPITDLDHADMAYEWLYGDTRLDLTASDAMLSRKLATNYPAYINSLGLRNPADGSAITADNYTDYLKSFIVASASRAVQEGCTIPDSLGFEYYETSARQPKNRPGGPKYIRAKRYTNRDFVVGVDLPQYLRYVAATTPLKGVPAFDGGNTPENSLFGDEDGTANAFTGAAIGADLAQRIRLMNPMYYIGDSHSTKAKHWYIRHGSIDRDTSFPVPVNLYTKLANQGLDVNFRLAWNRPHSGDYNLDDLFAWIKSIL